MKIAILGASGKTGTVLIERALANGHEVIAIARTPDKIASNDPRVIKRQGDAYDEASVVVALEGAEAVITTVGKTDLKDKNDKTALDLAKGQGYEKVVALLDGK